MGDYWEYESSIIMCLKKGDSKDLFKDLIGLSNY